MTTYRVQRSANGKQWDVIDSDNDIVEGGFFSKSAANAARQSWADEDEREAVRLLGDQPGFQDFPPHYR